MYSACLPVAAATAAEMCSRGWHPSTNPSRRRWAAARASIRRPFCTRASRSTRRGDSPRWTTPRNTCRCREWKNRPRPKRPIRLRPCFAPKKLTAKSQLLVTSHWPLATTVPASARRGRRRRRREARCPSGGRGRPSATRRSSRPKAGSRRSPRRGWSSACSHRCGRNLHLHRPRQILGLHPVKG